ncbi:MAG: type II toxin-antitoxin system VapC family toxin [Balneolaceae bacterium]|nr:type II toxin-antitoxin system VapC family toxin [Balneolaceae bacterium]
MIVDTNIIIDVLNGGDEAKIFIESKLTEDLLLSVVTVSEVYASIRNAKEIEKFENLLSLFEIIAINKHIAIEAGKLKKRYGASHGIRLPDAFIAATAITFQVPVATLDKKHFSVLTKSLVVPY